MQSAVYIPLSHGEWYRFGVYASYEEAHRIAGLLGGVVQRVA